MKVVFIDDSTIVLKTLNTLVSDLIEDGIVECEFHDNSSHLKKMIESEELEYDLLFVDINMPQVTGYDIAKTAKAIEKYSDKPIIAVTSAYTQNAKDLGKEVGIDDWFVKSIVTDSLQSSIINSIKQLSK